jgi:hypothetical protein
MDYLQLATTEVVKGLLCHEIYDVNSKTLQAPFKTYASAIEALNAAIRHGGGHTLHPHIGGYWLAEYYPGIKISLTHNEGEEFITEKVSRSLVIQIAEKCLQEYKYKNIQLTLF